MARMAPLSAGWMTSASTSTPPTRQPSSRCRASGRSRPARSLAARAEQPFAAAEELLERGIVGESVYEDIVELVRVSG